MEGEGKAPDSIGLQNLGPGHFGQERGKTDCLQDSQDTDPRKAFNTPSLYLCQRAQGASLQYPTCRETHFCFLLEASRLGLAARVVCCDQKYPDQKQLGEEGFFTLHSHIKVLETGTEVEAIEGPFLLSYSWLVQTSPGSPVQRVSLIPSHLSPPTSSLNQNNSGQPCP